MSFEKNCPRLHHYLQNKYTIFWMIKEDWYNIKNTGDEPIEVEIADTPLLAIKSNGNFLNALYVNENYPIIEIYRYDENDIKKINKDKYRVCEDITDLIGENQLTSIVVAASTQINQNLESNLEGYVILLKLNHGKDHHLYIHEAPHKVKIRLLQSGLM